MRTILKKLALKLPPIKRLIAQRDLLLIKFESASAGERCERNKHRPYVTLNAVPSISKGSIVDDKHIVERLTKAYKSSRSNQYGKDSMWSELFNTHHRTAHDIFMSGDTEKASQILANPASNNMFYGFDELCEHFTPTWLNEPQALVNICQDNLIRLAEAFGAFRSESPEHSLCLEKVDTSTDEIIQAIEDALGAEIVFPDIYPDAVGAKSCRGTVTYRSTQALYLPFRLSQIINVDLNAITQPRICEIGAGLGRTALFANQLGLKDYTLVDIPMTTISQGYYLMRCLGEDAVVLPGEKRKSREQIRLMHSEDFFASDEKYDVIVNVDSLTELGNKLATEYLRKISEITPYFLSINHECNPVRVIDLLKELEKPCNSSRFPYWMRNGYVEELIRF